MYVSWSTLSILEYDINIMAIESGRSNVDGCKTIRDMKLF